MSDGATDRSAEETPAQRRTAPTLRAAEPMAARGPSLRLRVPTGRRRGLVVAAVVVVVGALTAALTLEGERPSRSAGGVDPVTVVAKDPAVAAPGGIAAPPADASPAPPDGPATSSGGIERPTSARSPGRVETSPTPRPSMDTVGSSPAPARAEPQVAAPSVEPMPPRTPPRETTTGGPVETRAGRRAAREFARSLRALQAGDRAAALAAGAAAWRTDPRDPRIASHLASVHLELGEAAQAERWCRRAIDADPSFARAWINLGAALRLQDRHLEAIAAQERALALVPGDWKAMAGLAAAQRSAGDLVAALETLRRSIDVAPQRAELRYALAITHERAGDLERARRAFTRYLELSAGADPPREALVREWLARRTPPTR